jgi:hypothetical protein
MLLAYGPVRRHLSRRRPRDRQHRSPVHAQSALARREEEEKERKQVVQEKKKGGVMDKVYSLFGKW